MKVIEGGVEEQTKQALANLTAVIKAGGSDLGNVLKCTVFIKNMVSTTTTLIGTGLSGCRGLVLFVASFWGLTLLSPCSYRPSLPVPLWPAVNEPSPPNRTTSPRQAPPTLFPLCIFNPSTLLTPLASYPLQINAIYSAHFAPYTPARSCVEVAKLPLGVLVEVECSKQLPSSSRSFSFRSRPTSCWTRRRALAPLPPPSRHPCDERALTPRPVVSCPRVPQSPPSTSKT